MLTLIAFLLYIFLDEYEILEEIELAEVAP